jgi:AraC-like DNA-binding protein
MEQLREMADLIARNTAGDGIFSTAIQRLTLIQSSRPTLPMPNVYEPALCLVAQGRKQAMLNGRTFTYDPARYLIVSVELPILGRVVDASPEEPYLCLTLNFDPVALSELVMQIPAPEGSAPPLGMTLCEASPPLLDAAIRLLRLLDDGAAAPVLAPLAEREILFRLLCGPYGSTLRQIASAQGRVASVSRAIGWIKQHFAEPFSIDRLAGAVGMSASSLHEHFKSVTAMSPLQYQKQLRLQEARRLMLGGAIDAATAAFRVGYESPSQFSREYRRLFGDPPARDISRLRASPELFVAA